MIEDDSRILEQSRSNNNILRLLTQNSTVASDPSLPPNPNGFEINRVPEDQGTDHKSSTGGSGDQQNGVFDFLGGRVETNVDYPFEYKNVNLKSLPHFTKSLSDSINIEWIDLCINNPSFLFCEYYCQKFNFGKATPTFDGDIEAVKQTFDTLRNYKYQVNFLKENDLNADFIKIERYVDQYYSTPEILGRFIISTDPSSLDVSELKTDFTTLTSINPFILGQNNTLEFSFKFVPVLAIKLISILTLIMI